MPIHGGKFKYMFPHLNMNDQVKFSPAHPNINASCSQYQQGKNICLWEKFKDCLPPASLRNVSERECEQILQLSLPPFSAPLSPVSTISENQ